MKTITLFFFIALSVLTLFYCGVILDFVGSLDFFDGSNGAVLTVLCATIVLFWPLLLPIERFAKIAFSLLALCSLVAGFVISDCGGGGSGGGGEICLKKSCKHTLEILRCRDKRIGIAGKVLLSLRCLNAQPFFIEYRDENKNC